DAQYDRADRWMGELRIHGIAAPSYGLWTGWSAPDNRCLLQFHHIVCWQYHCRFGGHTRFRVIVTSCGRALGRYAIAQPTGDLATARHPLFNGRTPSSQGGQQLSRSYGRRRSAGGSIRLGAFARRSQTDRQYGRGGMACNAESGRQSHFDVYTGHQRICYGAVVVTGGSHTLGNACCRKYLRHRSAIQCVLQDRVVSYRHVNRYVDHHDFLLADLVWGWLSETRGLPSRDQMSAFGPKQTWASALHMSAFGGKADMPFCTAYVR